MMELSIFPLDSLIDFSMRMGIFLIALAALIFVHELGHFLFARKYGVVVEKFALGFGPKLIGFTKGGTEYLIAAVPLGGYVKMKGEDPDEEVVDPEGSFAHAKVQHRLAIAFGGPLFNILFAVLIYLVVYMNGVATLDTTVGPIRENSPAQAAGLMTGDKIVEVDGRPTPYWDDLLDVVRQSPGKKLEFVVDRNNHLLTFPITPMSEEITDLFGDKEKVGLIGIGPLVRDITSVEEGSPAEQAGIQAGDTLLSVDGTPISGWSDLKKAAIDKPGQELTFRVLRQGGEQEFKLTPESKVVKDPQGNNIELGFIGFRMSGKRAIESYGPLGALQRSLEETWNLTYMIGVSIKKMIFGSVSADNIGGPIMIFQIYGEQAKQGFNELIRLTALLSINLGLINLLPIPVLDGGHIFFFLIEMIKGRPVSEKNRERASQVGVFMLLSLMVFAFYNDIMRIIN